MSRILNEKIYSILKNYWNFDSFRENQKDIIDSILDNNDTIALIPTGGGKSLCFQLPALALDGCCLVISPLIALMNDQVDRLKSLNIPAEALHSGMDRHSTDDVLFKFAGGSLKLLYISPERLQSYFFRSVLQKANISFIAVDEAHCISQWGYDFRPDYRKISDIKKLFPGVPIAAFTATANKKTLADIKTYLELTNVKIFRGSFLKKNIRFGVIKTEKKLKILRLLLKEFQGSGIIYMRSRRGTEKLNQILKDEGFNCAYYHAGMDNDERSVIQKKWLNNEKRIIISTTAFGMGIDKSDVRFVIHYDLPTSMEEYYQEAGRAGRDGELSDAVIIYSDKNLTQLENNNINTFPTHGFISEIYNKLYSYYKINTIPERGLVYNFELNKFLNFAGGSKQKIYKAITELERYGYLELSHSIRDSYSLIKVLVDDKRLTEVINMDKPESKVINAIIHLYEDVFSVYSQISEARIADNTGLKRAEVIAAIINLHNNKIVSYQKKNPGIRILFKSIYDKEINLEELDFRKKRLIHNINSIRKYLEYSKCRQKFILNYFDEKLKTTCDICDICLKSDLTAFSDSELASFREKLSNFEFEENAGIDDLAYIDTYLKRGKQREMIKYLIKTGELKMAGDKIIKNDD